MNGEMKICVSYLRVSTVEQTQNFSLSNQRDIINAKAKKDGYELIKEFEDAGESAKNTDRPQLQELLKFCTNKSNSVDAVYVYKWDRFSRSQLDFLTLRQLLAQHGVSLISATETSGTTPEALFLQGILTSAAQYENDLKSARIKEGNRKRFNEGYTSYVPFGYKLGYVGGRRCGVPDENYQPLQKIWHRIAEEKWTLAQTRRELNKLELQPKPFYIQTLSHLFNNPYYMGSIYSKKYKISAPGRHIALVTEEVFHKVRFFLFGRKIPTTDQRLKLREESPLRGILLCPHCGNTLTSAPSRARSGKYVWYYFCRERVTHRYYGLNAKQVHEQLLEFLEKVKANPGAMQYHKEMMRETYEEEFGILTDTARQIEHELSDIVEMLDELEINKLKKLYTDADYLQLKDKLKIKYAAKKSLLSEKQIDRIDIETVLEWTAYYLTHLGKCWEKTSVEGKRAMQGSLFPEKITFDGKIMRTPILGTAYNIVMPDAQLMCPRGESNSYTLAGTGT
jgi:site-specific DNA recombinase